MLNRRAFLHSTVLTSLAISLAGALPAAALGRRPRVLVRNGWQTVNIGDIGHVPGILHLLEQYLPDAEVWLWPSDVGNGVEQLLQQRFPKVRILKRAEVAAALSQCDFLLHGSGASLVATTDVKHWRDETGKPYGIFGITISDVTDLTRELLSAAQFVYFRDSVSLALAKSQGVTCKLMEFGPDSAFAVDLRNDSAADAFLQANDLETGKFLCCIPRLRYTPYWLIKEGRPLIEKNAARNEEMREHDHKPLREAIVKVVRETDCKILLCPEDRSQMAIGKENIYDKLPDDVRPRVVWREEYWLTDEALSTYVRSAGLFGLEMHSPIMCVGNGVPAIVGRFAEQTSKGLMWRDIGLGDWLFDFDNEDELQRFPATVVSLVTQPEAARNAVNAARKRVEELQKKMVAQVATCLAELGPS